MNNLYLILKKNTNQTTMTLFEHAAKARGIQVTTIYSEEFDFTKKTDLTELDGLYNLCDDAHSQAIEKFLMNGKVVSFYTSPLASIYKIEDTDALTSTLIHKQMGLPIVDTIPYLPQTRELAQRYVDSLGGFPIILKSTTGSHGVGVMKVDSLQSLLSILDYLGTSHDAFIMRRFVPHTEQARLIVLGSTVLAAHTNIAADDFRTNVGDNESRQRVVKNYSDSVYRIAVEAVNSLGYEFGGVDLLFDKNTGEPYIAEVNFPCYFATTQFLTNIDIAGAMIDYLIDKSARR